MGELRKKLHYAKLGILASIPETVAFCNALVAYAAEETSTGNAVTQKIQKSSTSIYGILKLVFMSLLVVVLAICGGIMIIGTQKMKESVKENFYSIAIGVAVLFLAKEITDWLESVFG
jgi:uncharacterized membrane protein